MYGLVDLDRLHDAMTEDTILVSIMSANNEIGTVQPIAEIGKLCKDRGVMRSGLSTRARARSRPDTESGQYNWHNLLHLAIVCLEYQE